MRSLEIRPVAGDMLAVTSSPFRAQPSFIFILKDIIDFIV